MATMIGATIAIEMPIGGQSRVVCGAIESEEERDGRKYLRVVVTDEGDGGSPVLLIEQSHVENVRHDVEHGCEYFLRLEELK